MKVDEVLHMNSGEGKQSYSNNSSFQSSLIMKSKPQVREALLQVLTTFKTSEKLNVADLGCSSGPSALLAIDMILDIIGETDFRQLELQAFLTDLPGNDFNSVFKAIPSFYDKVYGRKDDTRQCFISATPGTFYGRLFPSKCMHFVYSASSLHWLSQVPPELTTSKKAIVNKGNIAIRNTTSRAVFESYLAQFHRDLTVFLKSRSEEIVSGGCMVLVLVGRRSLNHSEDGCNPIWCAFTDAFIDMIREGFIEEEKVDSFNMPYFNPHMDELREIIQAEGSFDVIRMEEMALSLYLEDDNAWSSFFTSMVRAFTEPLLAARFGEGTMDELFDRYKEKVANYRDHKGVALVASLRRRT